MQETVESINTSLPIKHQIAKLVIATIVGFAASKLSENGYDAALACYRSKKLAAK